MSYRQNNKRSLAWREWLRENEDALNECHLPDIVLSSEAHWWDFLMHGYLDHHDDPSGFVVDNLSPGEMRCLKRLLESKLTGEEKQSALILGQLESALSNVSNRA
jgi:hypothetical protein